jgi:ABC-type Na+ efflux pump permease subunit
MPQPERCCLSEDLRKQHAPQTPTPEHAAADQEAHKTAVFLVAMFAFVAFVTFMLLLLVPPFAQEMHEEKPAQTLAPHHTTSKHQAHETAFLVPAALLPVLSSAFLVLALLFAPLTQNVGEHQTTESPPAHDVATNQEANEAAFFVCCAPLALALALFLSLILAARLAEQVGEKQRAQAPAPDHAAANQQAHEMTFLVQISLSPVPGACKGLFTHF